MYIVQERSSERDIGVYFLDIISSMERIAGYAFTIARYILSQNDEEE